MSATARAAGSRRFWITVFCFAVANVGIWIGYDRLIQALRHARLEVEQSAPRDKAQVSGRPTFWWTFNLDVSPAQPTDVPPGQLQPPISGRWNWDNPRTLSFVPDKPLPQATPLTLTLLPQRFATPDGFRLAAPYVTTVQTPALDVVEVRQLEFDEKDRLVLELQFNDDVIATEALSHLSLEDWQRHPIPFQAHGSGNGKLVRVITDMLPKSALTQSDAFVTVRLTPGLSGRSGPLPMSQPYQCNLPIGSQLVATEAAASLNDGENPSLLLRFNNPVDVEVLKPLLSVDPAVPFTVSHDYSGIRLSGAFQPATRYAITIARAPAGIGRSQCPRPDTLSVFVPDRPASVWFEHDEGYLGSLGNRTLLAHAVNLSELKVSLSRVYDNNLIAWRNTREGIDSFDQPLVTRRIKLANRKNQVQDVRLSLDELLGPQVNRDGAFQLRLDAVASGNGEFNRSWDSAVVTLSDIGLTAKEGRTALTVWATSLASAKPLSAVRVRLYSSKNQLLGEGQTDESGLVEIHPTPCADGEQPAVILADRPQTNSALARDLTWLDLRSSKVNLAQSDIAGAPYLREGYEAFLYTDRGVYRPGETVYLRAIVRGVDGAVPPTFPVRWRFRRPDLHNWKSVDSQIDADGAVSLSLPLPDDLPTGRWSVELGLPGGSPPSKSFGASSFSVEDFIPNRMQVSLKILARANTGARATSPSPFQHFPMKEDSIGALVHADYLFGKPVSNCPARMIARVDPIPFAPPDWKGWTFGDAANTAETLEGIKQTGHRIDLPEQTLDEHGSASFDVDVDSIFNDSSDESPTPRPRQRRKASRRAAAPAEPTSPKSNNPGMNLGPWRLTLTASVIETGGRAVSATQQAQLDPLPWYIAVRPHDGGAIPVDAPATFDIALVDPSGKLAQSSAQLDATLYQEDWNNSLTFDRGRYAYHSTRLLNPSGKPQPVRVAVGKASLDLKLPGAGAYVLRLRDARGAITSIWFCAGQGAWRDNISRENPEKLQLLVQPLPSRARIVNALKSGDLSGLLSALHTNGTSFRAGDSAQVIVRSPFAGRLLLTVETDDLVSTRVVDMPAANISVPIQISRACAPNAYITASVIRPIDPNVRWSTHRAFGTLRLPVDNSGQKLLVQIEAPSQTRPETSVSTRLRVTDASGAPVPNAALTVAAVDEGICQLTGFATPDPFAYFTRNRGLAVSMADLYSQLMPEVPKVDGASPVGGDRDAYDPRHTSPVSARRVKPVALMSSVIHTDAQGFAQADFSVPQFAGKLRLMAVASAQRSFGSAESALLIRSPLLVQSSWPRFAAPGDRFMVPLVVFNNSAAAVDATVSLQIADGPLNFGKQKTLRLPPIHLDAGGQSTQLIEATAAQNCGVSHVSLAATAGAEQFHEDLEIPVRPASPQITLGGYAVATPVAAAQISLPGGMLEGTAHLQLKVTPWPTLQLPSGLDYLERYPYGCLEQTTSALFPLVYLPDIGPQIAPGIFQKERVAMKVAAGITRLIGMQTADGGLAMWPAYRDSWPWGSVYAAQFLIEAQNAGYPVPADFRDQLLSYVRNLLNQSSDDPQTLSTQAYACYVLSLSGKPPRPIMNRLNEIVTAPRADHATYPAEARMHLAAAWLAAGRRDLAQSLIPQDLPPPSASRNLFGTLDSPIRDRAVLVDTLLAVQPDNPALPSLVQQLADAGQGGQWRSTQDTAFAVLAIGRYLNQSKSAQPYADAQLLLDGRQLAHEDSGKPILWNAGSGHSPLPAAGSRFKVQISGGDSAKAHVTWLMTGTPLQPPPPADHGLAIRRRFLDERGQPLAANRVRSGDLVQVQLTLSSSTSLRHVVIDELLPAGLEIENPRLKTTVSDEKTESASSASFMDTRLDMRDDRLIIVGDLSSAGPGTFTYTARAITAGTFVLPPVHAECMYDNAINSLAGAGTFQVVGFESSRIANLSGGE